MDVQFSSQRRALLSIFQVHNISRTGILSAKQIERDWKQTGLRRADLEVALKKSIKQHLLVPRRTHDGMSYELTYLGECAMQFKTTGGWWATIRDWVTLRSAKRRQRAPTTENVSHDRRTEDHEIWRSVTPRTKK